MLDVFLFNVPRVQSVCVSRAAGAELLNVPVMLTAAPFTSQAPGEAAAARPQGQWLSLGELQFPAHQH